MAPTDAPVLVVGAGPVGLMASLLLAQQGIRTVLVDRRDGPHRAPQAHVVNPRTLEICRAAGLDMARLRALATRREDGSQVVFMTTLAGDELGRLPYERQGDEHLVYTPTPLLNLSQHLLEPVLVEYVRAAGVDLRYGHQWEALAQDEAGVTSCVHDVANGRRYDVRSEYVLAADGAGSRIRRALGIELVGPDALQSFVMIHFEGDLRALVRERPGILYFTFDPESAGAFVAHDIARTWVFMHAFDPTREPSEAYTERRCVDLVRRALGTTEVAIRVRDVNPWTMTAQVAERYGVGRVVLLGDSAHRFPPTGGLGMNTGVQDAHNLVWKLRAMRDGWAPVTLLDTYAIERRPVAQHNADQSVANAMKMLAMFEALGISEDPVVSKQRMADTLRLAAGRARVREAVAAQQEHFDMFGLQLGFAYEAGAIVPDGTALPAVVNPVRDFAPTGRPGSRVPHAWVEHRGARVSTLDLLPYDRFTVMTGPSGAAWAEAAAHLGDVPIQCLMASRDYLDPGDRWTTLAEIGRDGALLVRPDQHVAWRTRSVPANPAATLDSAVRAILGRPDA
jgi:2,4-dichlorophenol 6-monooxygenase